MARPARPGRIRTAPPRSITVGILLACPILLIIATSGVAQAHTDEPCIGCVQCHDCGGGGGGGGCSPVGVTVSAMAYNGSAYAIVNGTAVYNNETKTVNICLNGALKCVVNGTDPTNPYVFVDWYSSLLLLANKSSCSTTFTSLQTGSETLTLLLKRSSGNWAGYDANLTGPLTEVEGVFTVPSTQFDSSPHPGQFGQLISEWVGIGGQQLWWPTGATYLWQAGVSEQYLPDGTLFTYLWYEAYPADPVYSIGPGWHGSGLPPYVPPDGNAGTWDSTFEPNAGDSIWVLISIYWNPFYMAYLGNVSFIDVTTGVQDNSNVNLQFLPNFVPSLNSPEWIVESETSSEWPTPIVTSPSYFSGEAYIFSRQVAWHKLDEPSWFLELNDAIANGPGYLCSSSISPTTGSFSVSYSVTSC